LVDWCSWIYECSAIKTTLLLGFGNNRGFFNFLKNNFENFIISRFWVLSDLAVVVKFVDSFELYNKDFDKVNTHLLFIVEEIGLSQLNLLLLNEIDEKERGKTTRLSNYSFGYDQIPSADIHRCITSQKNVSRLSISGRNWKGNVWTSVQSM
jgi:hypothetical protein